MMSLTDKHLSHVIDNPISTCLPHWATPKWVPRNRVRIQLSGEFGCKAHVATEATDRFFQTCLGTEVEALVVFVVPLDVNLSCLVVVSDLTVCFIGRHAEDTECILSSTLWKILIRQRQHCVKTKELLYYANSC